MRDKRRFKEKLLAFLLMAAVAVTMIPAGVALCTDQAEAQTTYSFTVKRPTVKLYGEKVHVATFTVSKLGLVGACCQVGTTAKAGKTTVKKLSNSDVRSKLLYYYGYKKGYLGKTNKNGFLLGRALSWSSGNTRTWPASSTEVKAFIKAMPDSVSVPNRFECYFCDPTNGSQNFVAYKMNQPGYVTLNKTSADPCSLAAGSGYSFEGIEYTVYDSKGDEAGTLTCKANGATNTLTLDTGTYTVKETRTNQWYKLNGKEYTKTIKAGETWVITAEDVPETGTVHIRKRVAGEWNGDLAFDFRLINTANPAIQYTVRTDAETGEADVRVLCGTYRCEEILTGDSELVDVTGQQTAAVGIGDTVTFERENKAPSKGMLQIRKTTNDGGSAEGFRFKVTGLLYNQGRLTENRMLEAAEPSVSDYDEDLYEPGEWTVSENDLDELNRAAADRETGKRAVELNCILEYKGGTGVGISDITGALNPGETEGIIEQGTLISDDDRTYKAREDVAFAVVFEDDGVAPGDSAAAAVDEAATADIIRELLSGALLN